jgi:hypothetical protein
MHSVKWHHPDHVGSDAVVVSGSLFRVSGCGFSISGLGFGFEGLGFRLLGFGLSVSGFGFRVSGFGFRVSGFGFRTSVFGVRAGAHVRNMLLIVLLVLRTAIEVADGIGARIPPHKQIWSRLVINSKRYVYDRLQRVINLV